MNIFTFRQSGQKQSKSLLFSNTPPMSLWNNWITPNTQSNGYNLRTSLSYSSRAPINKLSFIINKPIIIKFPPEYGFQERRYSGQIYGSSLNLEKDLRSNDSSQVLFILTCRETGLDCDFVIKGKTKEE